MSDPLSKISYASSIVDMSDERTDQSMRTTLKGNFADSGNVCFGVVILSLVLALVLAQEKQDNRPQHLINVQFADQVPSVITRSVVSVLTSPEGYGER